ncbi:hypothetical protein BS50DRAFT_642964 [Corynespora cassiicola Philippines]|uniref:Ricin B lectin domain-containing protein n=1 Tax=Corynespora cassiicola Philippines TaxID=1448308 RepID=A0A2T2PAC3_CORCC|nr:hypothetical protein BS50DRAFT_642964 [Corynespora cassiicola Philippines]
MPHREQYHTKSKAWTIDIDTDTNTNEPPVYNPPSSQASTSFSRISANMEPSPGKTYIIKSISNGDVMALVSGNVTLAEMGSPGSAQHWACIKGNDGRFGFRNLATGKLLGQNSKWNLVCSASNLKTWEEFRVKERSEGGYVLLMRHWDIIRPVGKQQNGDLAMVES